MPFKWTKRGAHLQDYLPQLAEHLFELQIETHMFASQWFLTLYTVKFPLSVAYHIIDLFLAEVS